MLFYILFFTFVASILSLFLVAIFLLYQKLFKTFSFHLISFAAGALLATGLLDTLPEAIDRSKLSYFFVTLFIAAFFLVEKIFLGMHHHHEKEEEEKSLRMPLPLLLFGDALHNFIDGVSIASTFLVSFPVGLITSAAVFVHEIPHELGDFGILIHLGYNRTKVLGFNILTGIGALFGAVIGFYLANQVRGLLPVLLSLTTANFIYLSLSDLLPEVQDRTRGKEALLHSLFFLAGIFFIYILIILVKV